MSDIETFVTEFCDATPNPCHGEPSVENANLNPTLHFSEDDIGSGQTLERFWIVCEKLDDQTCQLNGNPCWQHALLKQWVDARNAESISWGTWLL